MNPVAAQLYFKVLVNSPFYLKYTNDKNFFNALEAIRLEPQSFIKVSEIFLVSKGVGKKIFQGGSNGKKNEK